MYKIFSGVSKPDEVDIKYLDKTVHKFYRKLYNRIHDGPASCHFNEQQKEENLKLEEINSNISITDDKIIKDLFVYDNESNNIDISTENND